LEREDYSNTCENVQLNKHKAILLIFPQSCAGALQRYMARYMPLPLGEAMGKDAFGECSLQIANYTICTEQC
jgi:hypothetical protein